MFSCSFYSQRTTDEHYITNSTDKDIVYIIYVDDALVKEDSLVCIVNGKTDTKHIWTLSFIFGTVVEGPKLVNYEGFQVFNLNDTTSYKWEEDIYMLWIAGKYRDLNIFDVSKGIMQSDDIKRESNWLTKYYLTVNDTLLSLMKKDSSMLERFKEYYKK